MLDKLPPIWKAIYAGVSACVFALGTGLTDGQLDGEEIWAAVGALVVSGWGTWRIVNKENTAL